MSQNTSPGPGASSPGLSPSVPQPVSISDPQAIRALAHEARLTVLEELFASQSTRTATELATRCELTPSAMSYHLRALEKYGYVVRAASEGDGRERRWKAAGSQLVLGSLSDSTSAKNAYLNVQLNAFRERLSAEIARRDKERKEGKAPEPDRAPVLTTGVVFLSESQRKDFIAKVYDLLYEYEALAEPEARGVDGERLYYMLSFLPEIRDGQVR
ncbi:ArsR/SmtB family transcription factor [Paeniglutamicibacter psychrophenolicus]|uniref:ArsR/SmtB family transcription factor n=1 Tax=Paeniglutamicibacter psychrophenolicus TaxID=257454 RepID=UPI00277FFA69|nr:winged helix-turn-helix domain-containing protein [Paeniglutamicibacter psychrophenolicus]MDQ0095526.1 DNA-binding transcriptional ArsR family regulator [Paeniglutamicibacter psychrophenolicus]